MSTSSSYYDSTYHAARYPELIAEDHYFWARAEVQARFYFTAVERQLRVFRVRLRDRTGDCGPPECHGLGHQRESPGAMPEARPSRRR